MEPETAGDPMSDQKWVRSSLRNLSARLSREGHLASPPTVGRLLSKLGYALHVNAKKIEASADHPDRQAQFEGVGKYKNAPNQLTEKGFTPPHREQMEDLVAGLRWYQPEGGPR